MSFIYVRASLLWWPYSQTHIYWNIVYIHCILISAVPVVEEEEAEEEKEKDKEEEEEIEDIIEEGIEEGNEGYGKQKDEQQDDDDVNGDSLTQRSTKNATQTEGRRSASFPDLSSDESADSLDPMEKRHKKKKAQSKPTSTTYTSNCPQKSTMCRHSIKFRQLGNKLVAGIWKINQQLEKISNTVGTTGTNLNGI